MGDDIIYSLIPLGGASFLVVFLWPQVVAPGDSSRIWEV